MKNLNDIENNIKAFIDNYNRNYKQSYLKCNGKHKNI